MSTDSSVLESEVAEVEMLLEAYFMHFDNTYNRLTVRVCQYVLTRASQQIRAYPPRNVQHVPDVFKAHHCGWSCRSLSRLERKRTLGPPTTVSTLRAQIVWLV